VAIQATVRGWLGRSRYATLVRQAAWWAQKEAAQREIQEQQAQIDRQRQQLEVQRRQMEQSRLDLLREKMVMREKMEDSEASSSSDDDAWGRDRAPVTNPSTTGTPDEGAAGGQAAEWAAAVRQQEPMQRSSRIRQLAAARAARLEAETQAARGQLSSDSGSESEGSFAADDLDWAGFGAQPPAQSQPQPPLQLPPPPPPSHQQQHQQQQRELELELKLEQQQQQQQQREFERERQRVLTHEERLSAERAQLDQQRHTLEEQARRMQLERERLQLLELGRQQEMELGRQQELQLGREQVEAAQMDIEVRS
jgi:hypothetical protein